MSDGCGRKLPACRGTREPAPSLLKWRSLTITDVRLVTDYTNVTESDQHLKTTGPRIQDAIVKKVLGTSVELWLNLQLAWDLYEAQHSPKAKEIDRLEKIA